MQHDFVPESHPSDGYEKVVTDMDLFSCYLFPYSTSNQGAETIAKVIINILTQHTSLPTTLISDKGSAFVFHVIEEEAGVLGITLKHAATKHAQTIGVLEQSHSSIKQALKNETVELRSSLQSYVSFAVIN